MRIVIDMQGAQTESRFRGIGRYTLSLAQAVVRNRGEHEIFLALNGLFPETIEPIRAAFDGFLPQENIRVWHTPGPVYEENSENDARREVAELVREAFLASLEPDVIHIASLFEGYDDNAVGSICLFDHSTHVTVSLYDLIPLLNPDQYLRPNPRFARYYQHKIEYLNKASGYFAISEFSLQEGQAHLKVPPSRLVNISTAIESSFDTLHILDTDAARLYKQFGLTRPFVLYTGGADVRKNLPRLIQAFAALPSHLRAQHQLLFAGRMPEGIVVELKEQAEAAGLKSDELCFTGYVSDEELVQLYNLCQLYVFPSWHEGFGLPALEAMACGAPVIGANTSSLPEVIGLDTALFDPLDADSIARKMAQALSDETFRSQLRQHGLQQTKKFSWDKSAKRAIAAWEALPTKPKHSNSYLASSLSDTRLIKAIAERLPTANKIILNQIAACLAQNQLTGIQRQLLVDISELCHNDAATGVQRVVRSYLQALLQSPPSGFRVEPVYATREAGYCYARQFSQRFLGLDTASLIDEPIQWQRGDVFFGLDMQHHVQLAQADFYRKLILNGVTVKFLVYDLLPIQLLDLFKNSDMKELHEQFLTMVAGTDGAICISKASADAYDQWLNENRIYRSPNFQMAWVHIGGDLEGSKPSQGLPADASRVLDAICSRPSFLSVSTLEPRKCQQQIFDALQLLLNEGLDVNLVLVGKQGWKIETLANALRNHPEKGQRLFWLEGISDEYLEKVYEVSSCLVAASINEGFGLPLIEAARHNIPIIARDVPVFREVAGDSAYYFSGMLESELAQALKGWLDLYEKGDHPKSGGMHWLTWQQSAEKLKAALVQEHYPRRQLLVDISELVQRDARSGIQRVVRSILKEWLQNPPDGYRVEPVYATVDDGYRYARCFIQSFLDLDMAAGEDELIDYAPGDHFFGLDLQPQVVISQREFYQKLHRQGVQVEFLVYDLLCIQWPKYFPPGAGEGFFQWLEVVTESDGAQCISKAVADELTEWIKEHKPSCQRPFTIDWFHLGADVDNSAPTKGLPTDAKSTLKQLRSRNSFLMVGTVEPRKGQEQTLAAFEQLWQAGENVNLVIVGKRGWLVDGLVDKIKAHPELNRRLFWLAGISDEYLEKVYDACACLIAASYGEGFGLPLIEAAQHKLPIIARDIPVFREVAGEHAFYFSGLEPDAMFLALRKWLILDKTGQAPQSTTMPWLIWKQSAQNLLEVMLRV